MSLGLGLGLGLSRNPPAVEEPGGGGELNPDPGFDNAGLWTLAGENDPPSISGGKLTFAASELGTQSATIALAQTYPAGEYLFSVDVDSISGGTVNVLLLMDGAPVSSVEHVETTNVSFNSAGAGQTATRNPLGSFNQLRVFTVTSDAVGDNVSLQAA